MTNYEKLSKDELLLLLSQRDNEINKKNNELNKANNELNKANDELNKTSSELNKINAEFDSLKVEYEKQKFEIRELNLKLNNLIAKYEKVNERKNRDIYNMFVSKREKLDSTNEVINEAEIKAEINKNNTKKRGRKSGSHNYTNDLEATRTIINELSYEERKCQSCGEVMIEIGEDRCKKIIKYPERYEVVEIITKKYACKNPKCDNKTVRQPLSEEVFGHSPVTPSVVADIINMKYNLAVPLDRYSKYLMSLGIPLSTQCLSNYVLEAAEILQPLYDRLKYELTHNSTNIIHADETTLNVLDIKDRKNCYMFVYTTSFYDDSIYIYDFSETRQTAKTEKLLEDFTGYLVCDGYKGYDKFREKLSGIQRCMTHARRYFYDVIKTLKPNELKVSKAKKVVEKFDVIFHAEQEFKKNKYTATMIKEKRNEAVYQKYIDELHDEIWSIIPKPESLLDKAVNYAKNSWDELFTYRKYGYLDISNNICERAVKPFVISRKNFLFAKTENGAQASGVLFSIIQTTKANGLSVEKYLEYVFKNIKKIKIDELLPWSEKIPQELRIKLK